MIFFFYGTLLRGEPNHDALGLADRARFLGEDAIRGTLHDFGDHPGAVLGGESVIRGELFELVDPMLRADLDALEDYDPASPATSCYLPRPIVTLGGRAATTYAPREIGDAPAITGGDWRAHRAEARP